MRRRILMMLLPASLAGLLSACESNKEELFPPPVVHTPLTFDPTEKVQIGPWWSNGAQMLRLDEEGSYALYGDMNRFHKPIQRGRWSRQSYAVLRLEPYERLRQEWIRVGVSRSEGRVALSVLDLEPMFAIDAPPTVAEDGLLGEWTGASGTLVIDEERRYTLSPAATVIDAPAIIAGHRGQWRLEQDRLILLPDPPNMGPFEYWVRQEGEETILITPGSAFRRPEPKEVPENVS